MGTLFSSFAIASSGLQVSQLQLDVTANNIANVNREGYSRQRVDLVSRQPISLPEGEIGRGVAVSRVERLRDEFLDIAFRRQNPNLGFSTLTERFYAQIEDIFLEPTGNAVGVRINLFFDALNDFANNVESIPARQAVVSEADALSETFNIVSDRLNDLITNANNEVADAVQQINSIGDQLGELNRQIRILEVGGEREASGLRDERDLLLDELSNLVDITYRERDSGDVDVQIAGQEFVSGSLVSEVELVRDASFNPRRPELFDVRFVETGRSLAPNNGELAAAFEMRDTVLTGVLNDVDTLAATIIEQANQIQSTGNGLDNLEGLITGTTAVGDPAADLATQDLPFNLNAGGSFDVVVYDGSGAFTATTVAVAPGASLNDIAASLNAVPNFTASVVDGRLELGAAPGFTYGFANDTSNALTALGVNTLFTGRDASDIGANDLIFNNPELLASATSLPIENTGDNTAAQQLAALRDAQLLNGNESTLNDFYEETITEISVASAQIQDALRIDEAFVDDFQRRRQEISGVNLDEEATNLLLFQRAFEASARVITTTDRMLEALLNVAR